MNKQNQDQHPIDHEGSVNKIITSPKQPVYQYSQTQSTINLASLFSDRKDKPQKHQRIQSCELSSSDDEDEIKLTNTNAE